MAGAGYRQFTPGQILTAEQVQTYLQDQSVLVFNDSAARSSALGTFVSEGMLTYLKDTDALEVYDGANWDNVNDNTNAILKNTFTASGQLIYSSGSATPVALGAGQVGQYLQSAGTSVIWADVETGGGSVWFNTIFNANFQDRYYYPLGTGFYWLEAFDKNGSTGPTGDVIFYNAGMTAIATATLAAGSTLGDSIARVNLSGSATYIIFNFTEDAAVVLTNAGSAQPVDSTGVPTVVTSTGNVVLTSTSTVYLIGGGGAGGGKTNTDWFNRGGGGSGYLTTINSVAAGTYAVTIGAGGAGSNTTNNGANGGSTIFGTLGTALGGFGAINPAGGNGGSGGGAGSGNIPNTAAIGSSGGINGGNGQTDGNVTAGTGSGVTLPWFLKVATAAQSQAGGGFGGPLYGGGAGGGFQNAFNGNGGNANGYGGGGGGASGTRGNSNSFSTAAGGSGFQGVIYVTGA